MARVAELSCAMAAPGGTTKMTCKLTMTGPKMVYVHNTYVGQGAREKKPASGNEFACRIDSFGFHDDDLSPHLEIVINS